MTKKNYIVLAGAIKTAFYCLHTDAERRAVQIVAEQIAVECKADNPRFDYSRFMEACGMEN